MNKSVQSYFGNKEIFAANLKRLLAESGKTQAEMARAINISTGTACDWVKGRAYPRMDKVQLLADYFGVQKSDLVEEFNDEPDEDKEVLELFHKVPQEKREFILSLIRAAIDNL